jgi:Cu2+-exporting ATPase
MRAGILLKSATALERLAEIDMVVFDKTGTLTSPQLALLDTAETDATVLCKAAGLAGASRHPLARALVAACGPVLVHSDVTERHGMGLSRMTPDGEIRLGSRLFAGDPAADDATGPELWFARPGHAPLRLRFGEHIRSDAAAVIAGLTRLGIGVRILSGDQPAPVAAVAALLGITEWEAACPPDAKVARIEALRAEGHRVLMVGDGLNDGPALAAAHVSISPSTATDLSQTVADVVFQGERLAPVLSVLRMARRTRALMRENLGLSLGYNLLMVPLAVGGYVTPWIAAAAMSSSSLLVLANSFRARSVTCR